MTEMDPVDARLEHTDLGADLGFLLARANADSVAAANGALAPLGLRARSYALLSIAASGLRPSQRELAAYLRLDPSQIVALVDDLERRGLVAREPDPTDRRAKLIAATPDGRRVLAAADAATLAAQARVFGALSLDERDALATLLARATGVAVPEPAGSIRSNRQVS